MGPIQPPTHCQPLVPSAQHSDCGVTLTLILLTWRIWRAPNNASKWQMGFNLAFKGLTIHFHLVLRLRVRGAMPLLPLYTFVTWTETTLRYYSPKCKIGPR